MNPDAILALLIHAAAIWSHARPTPTATEKAAYRAGMIDTLHSMGRPALADEAGDALALYFSFIEPTQEPQP